MKLIRLAAVAALTLISLMDIGAALSNDETVAVRILAPVLGVLGLIAAYGLLRRYAWGHGAALAAGAANTIGAVVAVVADQAGGPAGLLVSAGALVLAFLASYTRRTQPRSATN